MPMIRRVMNDPVPKLLGLCTKFVMYVMYAFIKAFACL